MKKLIVLVLVLFLTCVGYTNAQISKFVKTVKNNVEKEALGDKNENTSKKTLPEPASACTDATLILDLGGKLKVDYSEISITMGDNGSILVQDRVSSNYYIVREGFTSGPFVKGDPALNVFGVTNEDEKENSLVLKYKDYITKTGDKYLINFMGKKYGPYAEISQFIVTRSKDKFAAVAIENLVVTEDQGKKMEEEMSKAKTDAEKMQLAMKYAQQMQTNIMSKGTASTMPTYITNIPGANFDPLTNMGGKLNGNMKFDDILLQYYDRITDLNGKIILNITQDKYSPDELFISSDNNNYAIFNYGTITYKDKSTLPEVFNPHLLKADGKIYLAYMYYSPRRNSIMLCKVPF
jgi:DNA-binding transcriptional regulator of glucitol operon